MAFEPVYKDGKEEGLPLRAESQFVFRGGECKVGERKRDYWRYWNAPRDRERLKKEFHVRQWKYTMGIALWCAVPRHSMPWIDVHFQMPRPRLVNLLLRIPSYEHM